MEIRSDEFTIVEEVGWVHIHGGEGTTRLSLPKEIWIDLCNKTLMYEERMAEEKRNG